MRRKASILAVGNEVTDGQIANTNATWLARQLVQAGIDVHLHLAVPDHREQILWALSTAESQSDVLFVTGGLGPTRDDLTRQMIAEWLAIPLIFNDVSFSEVEAKLQTRQVPVRDGHRQQCYFPEGVRLWRNDRGTADAFSISKKRADKTIEVFVLPGPPAEIHSVWELGLGAYVNQLVPANLRRQLWTWSTLGLGESEVAHRIEDVIHSVDGIDIGFRLHAPYVETKIWALASDASRLAPVFQEIEKTLGEYLILRQGQDTARIFVSKVCEVVSTRLKKNNSSKNINLFISDFLSQGILFERLRDVVKDFPLTMNFQTLVNSSETDELIESHPTDADISFHFGAVNADNQILLSMTSANSKRHSFLLGPVVKDGASTERGRRIAVERALLHFIQALSAKDATL